MDCRIDPHFNHPKFRLLFKRIEESGCASHPLKELSKRIFTGITPKSGGDAYVVHEGVPFIRSGELVGDGAVASDIELKVTTGVHEGRMKRSQLRADDVLIAIVGATIGATAVWDGRSEANINQAIAGARLDIDQVLPKYLCDFLQTDVGQSQLEYLARPVARANINLSEIGLLQIPLPPPAEQARLVGLMEEARAARRGKLEEARQLLAGIDDFVLDALGLELPETPRSPAYGIRASQIGASQQLGADYYHPERMRMIEEIQEAFTGETSTRLGDIVSFKREFVDAEGRDDYLGLASVEGHTGELSGESEAAGGKAAVFKKHDVLFSRLRPYLNKVYLAESEGCCSTEFHVIRVRKKQKDALLAQYLAPALRSSVMLRQTLHMMTGNTHPRLANDDVVDLVIPLPTFAVQKKIAAEVVSRREKARTLRAEAARVWIEAKAEFERALLG